MPSPRLHALVVGVDAYRNHRSLAGAVRDAEAMAAFLVGRLGVPPPAVRVLLAPREPAALAGPVPSAGRPTYRALVAELRALGKRATADGARQVLFYYSGHGGRLPTLLPEVKGQDGRDECLVPPDAGEPGERVLHDVEIAWLLRRLAERDLEVTMILDCCHSGGVGFDPKRSERVRWAGELTECLHGAPPPVASLEELATAWGNPDRHIRAPRLPGSERVVVLAACGADEQALEVPIAGEIRGLFTYHLLEALRAGGTLTFRRLQDRVLVALGSARSKRRQTPELEGEADRRVFGLERLPTRRGFLVVAVVDAPGGDVKVTVGVGRLHGLTPGARLLLHGEDELPATARAIEVEPVEVELVEVGPASSTGRVIRRRSGGRRPVVGDRASVLRPGEWTCPVAVVRQGPEALPPTVAAAVERALAEHGGFAGRAGADRSPWLRVALAEAGVVLLDARGRRLEHVGEPLPVADPELGRRLLVRLEHLARWHYVRSLAPPPEREAFAGALTLELRRLSSEGDDRRVSQAPLEVSEGEELIARVESTASRALWFALFDLQPDWGISQVFPEIGTSWRLEAGGRREIRLDTLLPRTIEQGRDLLKVFATPDAAVDFAPFAQPPLGHGTFRSERSARRSSVHPLLATAEAELVVRRPVPGLGGQAGRYNRPDDSLDQEVARWRDDARLRRSD